MKLLRMLIVGFIVLLAMVCLTMGVLLYFINPNRFQARIVQTMEQQIGDEVVINGPMTWSFYPGFGIQMPEVLLRKEKNSPPFLVLHGVEIVTSLSTVLFSSALWEGDLYIHHLRLMHVQASNAHAHVLWQNKQWQWQSISASFYGGTLTGDVHVRYLGSFPEWTWDLKLKAIVLKPLLADMYGQGTLPLTGIGQMHWQGESQGRTRRDFLSHLSGTSQFSIENGGLTGNNIQFLMQSVGRESVSQEALFDHFTGTAIFNQGVARSDDLYLSAPIAQITGKGHLNLLTQALQLTLAARLMQPLQTKTSIPITVTGSLNQPHVQVDQQALQQTKASLREALKQQLRRRVGGVLENLLSH